MLTQQKIIETPLSEIKNLVDAENWKPLRLLFDELLDTLEQTFLKTMYIERFAETRDHQKSVKYANSKVKQFRKAAGFLHPERGTVNFNV